MILRATVLPSSAKPCSLGTLLNREDTALPKTVKPWHAEFHYFARFDDTGNRQYHFPFFFFSFRERPPNSKNARRTVAGLMLFSRASLRTVADRTSLAFSRFFNQSNTRASSTWNSFQYSSAEMFDSAIAVLEVGRRLFDAELSCMAFSLPASM